MDADKAARVDPSQARWRRVEEEAPPTNTQGTISSFRITEYTFNFFLAIYSPATLCLVRTQVVATICLVGIIYLRDVAAVSARARRHRTCKSSRVGDGAAGLCWLLAVDSRDSFAPARTSVCLSVCASVGGRRTTGVLRRNSVQLAGWCEC